MSLAVMDVTYANRRSAVNSPTNSVVYAGYTIRQPSLVMDTDELLARLDAKGVRNVDIARALGLPDSRIPEIRRKDRALKLDEAVKLVEAFELEEARTPLPGPIMRLIVQHIAGELGVKPQPAQLHNLAEDVRAFAVFAANPKVRRSLESAEAFFEALRLRRPGDEEEVQPQNDPERTN